MHPGAMEAADPRPGGDGILKGTIRNASTGEAIEGVKVESLSTGQEALTGPDGRYDLTGLPVGDESIRVSRSGFVAQQVRIAVRSGSGRSFDVALTPSSSGEGEPEGEVFEVTGKLPPTGKSKIQGDVRETGSVTSKVGGKELGQRTDSDAAQASQRLPGVNLREGKYVFVRGLGDRYSQTLLNKAVIPSPEPDKRVVPLDLFPVNIIDSIAIAKTYAPDLPGEFSGGSVQIETIDVPSEDFLKFGIGLKYRDGTTLQDFATYEGGNLDFLAFDDGKRQLPDEVPQEDVKTGSGGTGLTAEEVQEIGRSFRNIWEPHQITAPPEQRLSLSFGKVFGKLGDGALGITGAVNWANKYQTVLEEKRQVFRSSGEVPLVPQAQFNLDTSTFEAELSGVLNLVWEINEGQKVGIRNIYTRSAEDEVRLQTGEDRQRGNDIEVTRLRWIERSLLSTQPFGEHLLAGDLFLEWRATYSLSQRDEPDNRQVVYVFNEAADDFQFERLTNSGSRLFFILDENIYDGAIDLSIPFNPLEIADRGAKPTDKAPKQKIKLGPAVLFRDRDFNSRRFNLTHGGGPVDENGKPIDQTLPPEELLQRKNINPDGFFLDENTRDTDNYSAEQTILAAYALADFRLHDLVRVQAGARVEDSVQEVISFKPFTITPVETKTELHTTDVLPSVDLVWELSRDKEHLKDMQVRLGASQTVSRPEFRELAEFEYTELAGGNAVVGNPDLQRAKVWNFDLRWEWYPSPGDTISVGGFYKKFDEPIEQVYRVSSSTFRISWDNAESADLYGAEFEVKKSFDFLEFLAEDLRDLGVILNVAWIESEVTIGKESGDVQTNDKRPLQGQAEYVFNTGLVFESKRWDLTAALLANTTGPRISTVGSFGLPDEEEQPRWGLDFSIEKRFGKSALKLTWENILNDKYEYKQGEFTTREYKTGFAVGLSYSYSF